MIRTDAWQSQTIEELQKLLTTNEQVLAFALFGSVLSDKNTDSASDLDFLIVVSEEHFSEFFPNVDWLSPFGKIYAVQRFENGTHGTIRVCFFDFRRFDILVTTSLQLGRIDSWQSNPLWQGVRLLFSRSLEVTNYLSVATSHPTPKYPSEVEFEEMVNNFWFKAMLASYKVLHDDRLIAAHVALDLVRDCCVMGMILRDRATGTNIHRDGGEGNLLIDQWEIPLSSYSANGILDSIEKSSRQFEQLASKWSETYHQRRYPLLEWLDYVRDTFDKKFNSSQSEPGTAIHS